MKLKIFISLLTAFLSAQYIFAQPPEVDWSRTFGGDSIDIAYSVQQTMDGGYIYCGETESFGMGGEDAFLVKTDSLGYISWYRLYGGIENDNARYIQQTIDGGYVLIGRTQSFGAGSADMYLIRTDSQGDTLWTRTYGGIYVDAAYSGQQTTDGGYILAGYTRPEVGDERHVYLVKTDSLGDTLWTRVYGGLHRIDIWSVQQTSEGGYILSGDIEFNGSAGYDYLLVKTNDMGDTIWTRTFGGADDDYGYSVQQAADGGYVVAGKTWSFGAGSCDIYVVKTDSAGNTMWTRTYGGIYGESASSIHATPDSGFITVGGTSSFGAQNGDLYLVKIDALGDTIWTLVYGGPYSDYGYSVDLTTDGGYIVAGTTHLYEGVPEDCWLVKTGPDTSTSHAPVIEWVSHPKDFILHPAYPNPFNPTTTISYDMPVHGLVKVNIYNVLGQKTAELVNGITTPGHHHLTWNATDSPSGIYFVQLSTPTYTQTIKTVLLK